MNTAEIQDGELVTVVIPTHNRSSTIRSAIQSVLWQTYSDLEVIVVDDGSTDDTCTIVKSIQDARLRFLRLEHNKGANYARNVGWSQARGRWIAFQDSDDVWHPEKLSAQMRAIKQCPSSLGCFTAFLRTSSDRVTRLPRFKTIELKEPLRQRILSGNFVSTQTLLVSKSILEQLGGFDESLPRLQDWDLAIRIFQTGNLCYLDHPLVNAMDSVDSISRDPEKLVRAFHAITKKYRALYDRYPCAMARVNLHLVGAYAQLGDIRGVTNASLNAVKHDRAAMQQASLMFKALALSALKRIQSLRTLGLFDGGKA